MYFSNVLVNGKTLFSNAWFIGDSVNNKFTYRFIIERRITKINLSILFYRYLYKFNILQIKDSYIILLMFLIIYLFIYLSVNITYHRQNIIYNFISVLIVVVIFILIIFQFFKIYQWTCFINNFSNILKKYIESK